MVNKNNTSNPYAYNQLGQVQNPSTNPYVNMTGQELYAQQLRQYMPGAHTHTVSYPTSVHQPVAATPKEHQYSLAEVQLVSGGMIGMTINASIRVAEHLLKNMKETGFLHLCNEAEAIILRAEDVRAFKLTQLTTDG